MDRKDGVIGFFLPLCKDQVYQTEAQTFIVGQIHAKYLSPAKIHYMLILYSHMDVSIGKQMCFGISSSSGQCQVMAAL